MTKMDKLIFWGVLLMSIVSLALSNVMFSQDGVKTAVIEVDGKPYAAYQMQELKTPKTVKVKTEYGTHRIEISSESIKVQDADCGDRLCIGEIKKVGEMLVCLPNRVIVRIEGVQEVDSVAY